MDEDRIAMHDAVLLKWAYAAIWPERCNPFADDCAYCDEFRSNFCDGCPVKAVSGTPYCIGTPWQDAARAIQWAKGNWFDGVFPPPGLTKEQLLSSARDAATREYLFLLDVVQRDLGVNFTE